MPLPKVYQLGVTPVTEVADSITFATGSGIKLLYPSTSEDDFILASDAIYSDEPETNYNISGSVSYPTVQATIIFSTPIKKTVFLEGRAIITVPIACQGAGGGTTTAGVRAQISHYDGTTDTVLMTEDTEFVQALSPAKDYKLATVSADITRTYFKRGDTLRVKFLILGGHNNIGSGIITVGHDPQSRSLGFNAFTTTDIITAWAYIPIVVDI